VWVPQREPTKVEASYLAVSLPWPRTTIKSPASIASIYDSLLHCPLHTCLCYSLIFVCFVMFFSSGCRLALVSANIVTARVVFYVAVFLLHGWLPSAHFCTTVVSVFLGTDCPCVYDTMLHFKFITVMFRRMRVKDVEGPILSFLMQLKAQLVLFSLNLDAQIRIMSHPKSTSLSRLKILINAEKSLIWCQAFFS